MHSRGLIRQLSFSSGVTSYVVWTLHLLLHIFRALESNAKEWLLRNFGGEIV